MSVAAKERVVINVRGQKFETFMATLNRFPETLLGSHDSRLSLCNKENTEILLDRDKEIFNYVLFYYQSQGILAKPDFITKERFEEELNFFEITKLDTRERKSSGEATQMNESYRFEWIWNLLEKPDSSEVAAFLGKFNLCVIVVSTIVYCLETIKSVRENKEFYFFVIESIFVVWYTIEYLLRLLSAPSRCRFAFSALGVIDLLAVLPYYVTTSVNDEKESGGRSLAAFRFVRMIRVCRVLKISRYNKGLRILAKVLVSSKRQIKSLFLCMVIVIILMSSIIFHVEEFSNEKSHFNSIPDAFWFTIVTMTSVGYGDMVPVTILGKIAAVLCFIAGIILLLSLPVPIFISHFKAFYSNEIDIKHKQTVNKRERKLFGTVH